MVFRKVQKYPLFFPLLNGKTLPYVFSYGSPRIRNRNYHSRDTMSASLSPPTIYTYPAGLSVGTSVASSSVRSQSTFHGQSTPSGPAYDQRNSTASGSRLTGT